MGVEQPMEIEIRDVAYGGDGVGRLADGRAVFVPFSAVGDRLMVRLTAQHRRFARARIERVIEAGPDRVEPRCPYYGECGGCCCQHLTADEQVRLKTAQLRDLLARIGGVRQLPSVEEARPAPEVYGYRNKITLRPVFSGSQLTGWGYTRRDNVSVLPIETCPIARPELNSRLAELNSSGEAARWPSRRKPEPGQLVLRRSSTGEVLAFRIPPESLLTERVLDLSLRVSAGGFFQVNLPVLERLASWLREAYRSLAIETLVDGYCGCGVFALCLAGLTGGEVLGIESDRAAIRCAEENAQALGVERCRFVAGSVEEHLEPALKSAPRLYRAAVLLDPPRAGCSAETLATLMRLAARTIILLSCNPATLARDLARLHVGQEYKLRRLALFDMFPQTAYFEAAAILVRPS